MVPDAVRLSDGRLIQYGGYFELDAAQASARITYNRTVQLYDPKRSDDPWTVLSPTASTPVGTEPVNYTWISELAFPVAALGSERQIVMMDSGGATFLLNTVDAFADLAARFVALTPRPTSSVSPGILPRRSPRGRRH